ADEEKVAKSQQELDMIINNQIISSLGSNKDHGNSCKDEINTNKSKDVLSPNDLRLFLTRNQNSMETKSSREIKSPHRMSRSPHSPRRKSRSPQRIGRSPQRIGRSPQRIGRSPQRIGRSPQRIGRSPQRIGRSPQRIGRSPQRVGRSPHRISPHRITRSPHRIIRSPHRIIRSPHRIIRSPHRIIRSPHRITRSPHRITRSPHRITRSPHRITRSPHRITRSPHRINRSPQRTRSRSPYRLRSRSPYRVRSRSPYRVRSRSPYRVRSRSPYRVRSRSPYRVRSRSPYAVIPRHHSWENERSLRNTELYESRGPTLSNTIRRSRSPGIRRERYRSTSPITREERYRSPRSRSPVWRERNYYKSPDHIKRGRSPEIGARRSYRSPEKNIPRTKGPEWRDTHISTRSPERRRRSVSPRRIEGSDYGYHMPPKEQFYEIEITFNNESNYSKNIRKSISLLLTQILWQCGGIHVIEKSNVLERLEGGKPENPKRLIYKFKKRSTAHIAAKYLDGFRIPDKRMSCHERGEDTGTFQPDPAEKNHIIMTLSQALKANQNLFAKDLQEIGNRNG
ncbi:unnamed protein product, partial [Meganyctiphanes norvegica]